MDAGPAGLCISRDEEGIGDTKNSKEEGAETSG